MVFEYVSGFGARSFLWPIAVATLAATGVDAQLLPREDPPFVATPERLVQEMLNLGEVRPDQMVYDLGSGDGRIPIAAGLAGAYGVGIEYDVDLVRLSQESAVEAGVSDRVRFVHGDIFATDVSEADVVTLYLSPEFNLRLRPRLLEQLRPGTRVVSHAFHMGDWTPDSTVTVGSGAGRATLFSWIVPETVDGFWSLAVDDLEPLTLEIFQNYQRFAGTARRAASEFPVRDGHVSGSEIRFELATATGDRGRRFVFHGTVVDGALHGTVDGGPDWGVRSWSAYRFSDPARPERSTN